MDTWFQDSQTVPGTLDEAEPKIRKSLLKEAISSVAANILSIELKELTRLVTSSISSKIDLKSPKSVTEVTSPVPTAYVFIISFWKKEKVAKYIVLNVLFTNVLYTLLWGIVILWDIVLNDGNNFFK